MNTILKSIVILIDSREKSTNHITDYYDKHKINYERLALPVGDYSFKIPANEDLGILSDQYYYNDIFVERKNSAEELSGCFTQTRARFNEEFASAYAKRKILLIENCNYEDIVNGNYKTEYNSKSYLASLHSFCTKYDLRLMFMPNNKYSPIYIYGCFQYYLRYLLK
jgi:ERCC4-type nuclease